MVNLLPCPFCGGQCIDTDFDSSFGWCLSCDECGARGPQLDKLDALAWAHSADENRAKAIEYWNRRALTLFGLPIVEVDNLGDASQIVLGPPLINPLT